MRILKYTLILSILLGSCVEPADIETGSSASLLVVQGSLTNEFKRHWVRVSSTVGLNDQRDPTLQAIVWVTDDRSNRYNYSRNTEGVYESIIEFQGVVGRSYTLHVLQGLKEIVSTPQRLSSALPIDSIYVENITLLDDEVVGERNGLQFFLDAANLGLGPVSLRYELTEAYVSRVPFPSVFIWDEPTQTAVRRETPLTTCYKQESGEDLLVASTLSQSQNAIRQFPLNFVPFDSEKVQSEYAVRVRQFVISPQTFEFYRTLNENNQSSGSLFDSQKGRVLGNLSVEGDESEQILGYFEVAGVSEASIQLSSRQLTELGVSRRLSNQRILACTPQVDTLRGNDLAEFFSTPFNRANFGFGSELTQDTPFPLPDGIFQLAPLECTDCRKDGATLDRPSFWE